MKKSIVLATLDYPPDVGGVATYLSYFANRFPGGKMVVLAPDVEGSHERDMASKAIVYRRPMLGKRIRPRWLVALFSTWQIVRKEKPALLIVSHLLPMGQIARILRKVLRLKYVVIIHGFDIANAISLSKRKRRAALKVLKDAELIIANSRQTARWLSAFGINDQEAIIVLPPPSLPLDASASPDDIQAFRKKYSVEKKEFLIVSVARLVSRKGLDTGIRAVAELRNRKVTVKYLIVGDGDDRERLESLITELRVNDRVQLVGMLDTKDLAVAYSAADIFMMLPRAEGSDIEGYGIVYLEAGLLGLPVIGTFSGGVAEAVIDEETGILVPPDDIEATTEAIERLMIDEKLRKKLGDAGQKRVREEYAEDRQAKRFAAIMKRIMQ